MIRLRDERQRPLATAILLSLFVMPGAGHWYLGHRRMGSLFAAGTMIALLYPFVRYIRALNSAMRQLAEATGMAFPSALSGLHHAWVTESHTVLIGLIVVALLWVVGALDLLRYRPHGSPG